MAKHIVARVTDIPPGGRKIVEAGGRSIGLFNLDGEFFALRNRCPHQGGPLCEGPLWGRLSARIPGEFSYERGGIVSCGWHGWEFDIRTGQSWCEPTRLRVRSYPVSVVTGTALLAETVMPSPEAPQVITAEPTPETGPPIAGYIQGPYLAETYPVTVDGEYLAVEVPDN